MAHGRCGPCGPCDTPGGCTTVNCDAGIPQTLFLDVGAVANDVCGSCTDFNTTQCLQCTDEDKWEKNDNDSTCYGTGNIDMKAQLYDESGDYVLRVRFTDTSTSEYVEWKKDFSTTKPDCEDWDYLDLGTPDFENMSECDWSAATMHVSSVCICHEDTEQPCAGGGPEQWKVVLSGFDPSIFGPSPTGQPHPIEGTYFLDLVGFCGSYDDFDAGGGTGGTTCQATCCWQTDGNIASPPAPFPGAWTYFISLKVCLDDNGNYYIGVYVAFGCGFNCCHTANFGKSYGATRPTCRTLVDEDISFHVWEPIGPFGGYCQELKVGSGTCLITAV